MRLRIGLIATLIAALALASTAFASLEIPAKVKAIPLDVYFIMDKSASIAKLDASCKQKTGKTCWALMVGFVQSLVAKIGNVAGGIQDDALQIGLITFSCNNGKSIIKDLLNPATADATRIAKAMTVLENGNPSGGTCPSLGLQMILESIKNSDVFRQKAVLMITDGLIESQDAEKSFSAGRDIRAEGAMMFSVAVGRPDSISQRRLQDYQLKTLSGDSSRVFKVGEAAALQKIADLISILALDTFEAHVASWMTGDPDFCFSSNSSAVVTGPSIDHIQFGPQYAQSLICSFSSGNNSRVLESVAIRNSKGELICPIPSAVFPALYDASTGRFVRTTTMGLVLMETGTNQRRALKFSTTLKLPLSPTCLTIEWDENRCKNEAMTVRFGFANMNVPGLSCALKYRREIINVGVTEQANLTVAATADTSSSSSAQYVCEFPLHTLRGTPNLDSLDIFGSVDVEGISNFPSYDMCSTQTAASQGCYASRVAYTFEIADELLLDDSNLKCYYRDVASTGTQYESIPLLNGTTCSLPPFAKGAVALTTSDNFVLFKDTFAGTPPTYSTDCLSIFSLNGGEQQCIGDANSQARIGFQGRAIEILNDLFPSDAFECRFTSSKSPGSVIEFKTAIERSSTVADQWSCFYPDATQSVLMDRSFSKVSLWRVSNGDSIYESPINISPQKPCLDFSSTTSTQPALDVCWGSSSDQAQIIITGPSLGVLPSVAASSCHFSMFVESRSKIVSRESPLKLSADKQQATCEVPSQLLIEDVASRILTVKVMLQLTETQSPILFDEQTFQFTLNGCMRQDDESDIALDACWGSATAPRVHYNDLKTLEKALSLDMVKTFSCVFSDISANKQWTMDLTAVSVSSKSCALPRELLVRNDAGQERDVRLQVIGNGAGGSKVTLDESNLVLQLTDDCFDVSIDVPSSEVCWGESYQVRIAPIPLRLSGTEVMQCVFDNKVTTTAIVDADGSALVCSVSTKEATQPQSVELRVGLFTAMRSRSISVPQEIFCVEMEEGNSSVDSCAGASTSLVTLSGRTVAALAQTNEFLVCVLGSPDDGEEIRVRARYVQRGEGLGGWGLVCQSPAWMIWNDEGNFQPSRHFDSIKILTGFSNQVLFSSPALRTQTSNRNGDDCVQVTYPSLRPECKTNKDYVASIRLSGGTIDYLASQLQLSPLAVLCEFYVNDVDSVRVSAKLATDDSTLSKSLECIVSASLVPEGTHFVSLDLLVPQQLDSPGSTSAMETLASVNLLPQQVKDCFVVANESSAIDDLCTVTPTPRPFEFTIVGESLSMFVSAEGSNQTSLQCRLLRVPENDVVVFDGVIVEDNNSKTMVKCSSDAFEGIPTSAASTNIEIYLQNELVTRLPPCLLLVGGTRGTNAPASSDSVTSSQGPGAVIGAAVGVVLFAGFFAVGVAKRRSNQRKRALRRGGNTMGMEEPDVEREIAAVRRIAMSSFGGTTKASSGQITSMNSTPKPNPVVIKERLNLDAPPMRIIEVPDWVLNVAMRPAGLFGLASTINKPGSESYGNDELQPHSSAAGVININVTMDDEAWGVPGDIFQDPVTMLPGDLIRVSVDASNGLGVSLGKTADGMIIVEKFSSLKDGKVGPVEKLGVVWTGDQLMEIDDQPIKGWSLGQCSRAIRAGMKRCPSRVSLAFKTSVSKSYLGYGAFQVIVPRGVFDLGVKFSSSSNLTVASVNRVGPLRNVVNVGARLTALDGVPIQDESDLKEKLAVDPILGSEGARLRFEAASSPTTRKRPVDHPDDHLL